MTTDEGKRRYSRSTILRRPGFVNQVIAAGLFIPTRVTRRMLRRTSGRRQPHWLDRLLFHSRCQHGGPYEFDRTYLLCARVAAQDARNTYAAVRLALRPTAGGQSFCGPAVVVQRVPIRRGAGDRASPTGERARSVCIATKQKIHDVAAQTIAPLSASPMLVPGTVHLLPYPASSPSCLLGQLSHQVSVPAGGPSRLHTLPL